MAPSGVKIIEREIVRVSARRGGIHGMSQGEAELFLYEE